MDTVRVLRILEYIGPRKAVEEQIERSIHGSKTWNIRSGETVTIRAATLGEFPEILEKSE